ncbi:MAG: transcription antitermination factor NusB [Candidatus Moraniibacteriota bacterium]
MGNRHLARAVIMKSLYEWDFNKKKDEEIKEIIKHNIEEFAPKLKGDKFVEKNIEGILKKRNIIDPIIEKCAPEWPLEQITIVDRNILRLGIYELLFGDYEEVPPKVAINEAIELAKGYGGESSGGFVNGVLGAVYREMGEPMKEDGKKEELDIKKAKNSKDGYLEPNGDVNTKKSNK